MSRNTIWNKAVTGGTKSKDRPPTDWIENTEMSKNEYGDFGQRSEQAAKKAHHKYSEL